jgi:hypothetical protein
MSLISLFILLQTVLFFIIVLHDWVHLPPLTDIRALEKHHSKKERLLASTLYGFIVGVPLFLSWFYAPNLSFWVLITIIVFYALLSLGTIASWWIPYFFGSSAQHKAAFAEYRHTHHFLPRRSDNVRPNTFHCILHLLIWSCLGLAIYFLII